MDHQNLKEKTLKGVAWSGAERFAGQAVQFIIMLVLARLLTPHDYGLIGMLTLFIALSQSLIDSGFTQALIRKEETSSVDFSTVFYFNIVVSLCLYLIFYSLAPLVQAFFEEPLLEKVMRYLCLSIVINAFSIVPKAIFTINLNFKIQTVASVVAAVSSGVVGITLALYNMGVWSLVAQQLSYAFFSTLILFVYSKWRPILCFSKESFNEMFNFGSKLMTVGILNTLFLYMYPIVIGKLYASTILGFYTRGQHFAELPSMNLTSIVQRVTYPVMCKIQYDKQKFTDFFVRVLKTIAFLFFPLMCILAGVSIPLVETILGEKWKYCGELMIPLCFAMMWYPFNALNLNILQVVGKSDLLLKLEVVKKSISVIVLILAAPFGVKILCYSQALVSLLYVVINAWYTREFLGITFWGQCRLYLLPLLVSFFLFFIILLMKYIVVSSSIWLVTGIIGGGIVYLMMAKVLHFSEIENLHKLLLKK